MTSPNQTNMLTASLLVMITVGLVSIAIAQSVEVSEPQVYTSTEYGPVVWVACTVTYPYKSANQQIRWILSNRILTINGAVQEGESPKYGGQYYNGKYELHIRNAVKEDAGIYQCQLAFNAYGVRDGVYGYYTFTYYSNVNIVNIYSYLPALNYPECSIAPSTTLTQGTEATFNCTVGKSVPGVNLQLFLQNSDGALYRWLGHETSKIVVGYYDHDTTFVCAMTSETFPRAGRTCSVGPIIIPFGLTYWTTTYPTNLDPHIRLQCRYMFSTGSTGAKLRWIVNGVVIADNDNLVDADSSRYSVTMPMRDDFTNSRLTIQNAVKEDEGDYQCQVEYVQSGKTQREMIQITVPIESYLPALNYPECSIAPSTTLTQGTEATFNCMVGESVPGVNLELKLQRPDGTTYKRLGNDTSTQAVTFDDHNAMFVCVMTSDTFPTARRECSSGPIIIRFGLNWKINLSPQLGHRIVLQCRYLFSTGSTERKLKWIFNNEVMAENIDLVKADSSRYRVNKFTEDGFTFSKLYIRNAVKEDEGDYQCQAEYVQSGMTQREMLQITVPIDSYLPALNYPECSIETPSINAINETIFYNGTEATFNCTVGESVPNVNLQLILQRPDGTTKDLGNAAVTRSITIDDNNATFVCFMTSDKFLTGNRSCATGPITVLSQLTTSSAIQNVSTIIAIVGGTIGGIVILILLAILVLRLKRSKSETQSSAPGHATNTIYRPDDTVNNSQASLSPGSHQLTQPTHNQDDSEYAVVNKSNNSIEDASRPRDDNIYENTDLNLLSHAPQLSSASTNQDDSESRDDDMPVYETTEFDKSSPAASDSAVYSQVTKAPPVNSQVNKVPPVNSQVNDPPVYSQVNKGVKTDVAKKFDNKDKSHRESSGFVDNILYISSGPANADDIAYSREDDPNIYESTDIDTSQDVSSPTAPHPPIYSAVNKRAKTGNDDVGQDSHRESSGFVDNKIYVSSGPSNTDNE